MAQRQSQPPPPRIGNPNGATQTQSQTQGNQAPVTPETTAPTIPPQISIAPTFIQNGPSPNQDGNGSGTTADWWMVGLTCAIAVGTFVLAFIAKNQLRTQADNTREALRLSREANEASRLALLVAHRPQLVIRHVLVDGIDNGEIGERLYNGVAWVVNIGALSVTILSAHTEWLLTPRLPMKNPVIDVIESTFKQITLGAAEVAKIPIPDREIGMSEHVILWSDKRHNRQNGHRLYLIGFIKYRDDIGLRRRHFCYRYSPKLQRFVKINHPNYSYED